MAKGLNEVKLIGNLGQDPIVNHFDNGSKVVNFSLATQKTYKDQNGENVSTTQWHRIVAWNKLGDIIEKYLKKGSKCYIQGEIQYRTYEKEDGSSAYLTEIVANDLIMLSSDSQ